VRVEVAPDLQVAGQFAGLNPSPHLLSPSRSFAALLRGRSSRPLVDWPTGPTGDFGPIS